MRKLTSLFLIFTLLVVIYGCSKEKKSWDSNLYTYLWDTEILINEGEKILKFSEENNIRNIYLYINYNIENKLYRDFIKKAYSKDIKVYALNGAPNWALDITRKEVDKFYFWLTAYHKETKDKEEKFIGVHLDVEPYLISDWDKNRENILEEYQKFIIYANEKGNNENIITGFDIPFWFDEIEYNNQYGIGKLSDWVIKNATEITIMAYRDSSEEIIKITQNEIDYGEKENKKIIIGVEIYKSKEGDFISFAEEGKQYMKDELLIVTDKYRAYKYFTGFAIHDISSYIKLIN